MRAKRGLIVNQHMDQAKRASIVNEIKAVKLKMRQCFPIVGPYKRHSVCLFAADATFASPGVQYLV